LSDAIRRLKKEKAKRQAQPQGDHWFHTTNLKAQIELRWQAFLLSPGQRNRGHSGVS
jgi:hypothetical protein